VKKNPLEHIHLGGLHYPAVSKYGLMVVIDWKCECKRSDDMRALKTL